MKLDLEAADKRLNEASVMDLSPGGLHAIGLCLSDLEDALAENRRLREALEPFAAIARHYTEAGYPPGAPGNPNDHLYSFHLVPGRAGVALRLSDCQRAMEVLR